MNKEKWPAQKRALAAMFRTRGRDEWVTLLGGDDTCATPVLDWDEAIGDPHNTARNTFITIDGVTQPAPAPRFSRTPTAVPRSARVSGDDTHEILGKWGLAKPHIDRLLA
jgi:alpha-methylacyl-CoA racemase